MHDIRTERLARLLVDYCVEIEPGQIVKINGDINALPLIKTVYREALLRGAHPMVELVDEELRELWYAHATDEQLSWVNPLLLEQQKRIDARISIGSPNNTRHLSMIDPARSKIASRASKPFTDIFVERTRPGAVHPLKWVGTDWPCHALAQDAEMSLAEYENFYFGTTFADTEDPVSEWKRLSEHQEKIIRYLSTKSEARIRAADTDLRLSVRGVTWINSDGRRNMPSGEVFTCPVAGSVNGKIRFSFPAIYGGREVEDVRLEFRNGVVTAASAAKNEAYLHEMLAIDEGARRVGEFAFGTNSAITAFTRNILFDEKIGGTMHMALGMAYPSTGTNQSSLHWDMICDLRQGGEVFMDDELFMRDGNIVVPLS